MILVKFQYTSRTYTFIAHTSLSNHMNRTGNNFIKVHGDLNIHVKPTRTLMCTQIADILNLDNL